MGAVSEQSGDVPQHSGLSWRDLAVLLLVSLPFFIGLGGALWGSEGRWMFVSQEMVHSGNSEPDALRAARRSIYSATTRRRCADWEQYDRITAADKRVALIVRPDHIYGSALAKMREAASK